MLLKCCGHWRQGRYITIYPTMRSVNTILSNPLSCTKETTYYLSIGANTIMALRRWIAAILPVSRPFGDEMLLKSQNTRIARPQYI